MYGLWLQALQFPRIPGLAAALQALLPSLRVEEVDTLDPSICHSTDFLVAEHNLLGLSLIHI